jgi:hypothetical protein
LYLRLQLSSCSFGEIMLDVYAHGGADQGAGLSLPTHSFPVGSKEGSAVGWPYECLNPTQQAYGSKADIP